VESKQLALRLKYLLSQIKFFLISPKRLAVGPKRLALRLKYLLSQIKFFLISLKRLAPTTF